MKQKALNALLAIAIVALVIYVIQDTPPHPIPHFTLEQLQVALTEHHVESIRYETSSRELVGRIESNQQKIYGGDEFHLSDPLTQPLYQAIQEQRLSSSKFLGPIVGLDHCPEYEEHVKSAEITGAQGSPFPTGELVTYDLRVLAMSMGEISVEVLPPREVQGQVCDHFVMHVQTGSNFASIYRVDDQAETWVTQSDFRPLGFQLLFNESERWGGVFQARLQNDEYQTWKQFVARSGLTIRQDNEILTPEQHNLLSGFFALRRQVWNQPRTVVIVENEKKIELQLHVVRSETVNAPDLGPVQAVVLEPQIVIDGEVKNAPHVQVWIQQAPPHVILRIEADVKIGHAIAELKSYRKGS